MNETNQKCEYLLPCGYCDKKGAKCSVFYNEAVSNAPHEHKWILMGASTASHTYICDTCKQVKIVKFTK